MTRFLLYAALILLPALSLHCDVDDDDGYGTKKVEQAPEHARTPLPPADHPH